MTENIFCLENDCCWCFLGTLFIKQWECFLSSASHLQCQSQENVNNSVIMNPCFQGLIISHLHTGKSIGNWNLAQAFVIQEQSLILQNDLRSFESERTLKVPAFYFFSSSQLFGNDTISLVIWQELICMPEALSREKIVVYFVMLSCFSNGVFSRCQGRRDGEVQLVQWNASLPS